LLGAIDKLEFPRHQAELHVIVVDNDVDRSAELVCQQAQAALRWPLQYEVEPVRGIARARNRAVRCALERADFVAFLDDDEVPEPQWMDELVEVQQSYGAAVVTGPTLRCVSDGSSPWLSDNQFLHTRRWPTGQPMTCAFTGNVLVRSDVYRSMDALFPEHFGLGGGEDVHFFRRVHAAGHSIVWADEAVVREWVPASRLTARGLFLRACSSGNGQAWLDLEAGHALTTRLGLLREATYCVGMACIVFPLKALAGTRNLAAWLWHWGWAVGTLAAIVGYRFAYYRTTHGC
jgi:glycosyltransferase involved in cell wall biosynthesis